MDESYSDFINQSQRIFDSFPNERIWDQGGLQPNRQIKNPETGYCIIIRYDDQTLCTINKFMDEIREIIPGLVRYDSSNLHSTIGTHGKRFSAIPVQDQTIENHLIDVFKSTFKGSTDTLEIDFQDWIFNQEALLISGSPNSALWKFAQRINQEFLQAGFPLVMIKIFHITTARFTRTVSKTAFDKFYPMVSKAPNQGKVEISRIDLASWFCDGYKFELIPHFSIEL